MLLHPVQLISRKAKYGRIGDVCLAVEDFTITFFSCATAAIVVLVLDQVQQKINTCLHALYECV